MMSAFFAIYLREFLILKHKLKRQICGMTVSPLLYMLTFGFALGSTVRMDGRSYLEFLIPGLVAMSSMIQAFSIASDINVARFYFHAFEEFQAAPVSRMAFVLGETLAGLTKTFISIFIILFLGLIFGVKLHYGLIFWLAVFLNGFTFATLAVTMAMIVKSHSDQSLLSNFIITPMAFLGGTFFPLDNLPGWARGILQILPLSHASKVIRADAFGQDISVYSLLVLFATSFIFLVLAIFTVGKARD
jgi:Nod factor-specific ABC transporter NodJ protein